MNRIAQNHRETGARELQPALGETDCDCGDMAAAENKPPADGQGVPQNLDETHDRPGQSEGTGQLPATPSPETGKCAGAGPALVEHSKDAKAPRNGREPGAYVKD